MKILIVNGPNINMLGIREPEIYGKMTYAGLIRKIEEYCASQSIECECFQSNHEGAIIDKIQAAYSAFDGIIINPAAYTHTSIAIADALKAVGIPAVEVHISDIESREAYRRISYVKDCCIRTVSGKGTDGYILAIDFLIEHLSKGD